jgi:hypothetical protein
MALIKEQHIWFQFKIRMEAGVGQKISQGTIEETALAVSALASAENLEICEKG